MLWNQISDVSLDCLNAVLESIVFFHNLLQYRIVYKLGNAKFLRIFDLRNPTCNINHHRRENLYVTSLCLYPYCRHCSILDLISQFSCNSSSCLCDHFTCRRIKYIFSENLSFDTVSKCKFLIKLITSYLGEIVSSRIEEHCCNQAFCTFNGKWLARTNLLV